MCSIETVQDFLIKLDIKPLMHVYLLEITKYDLVRLTKIMNNLVKDLKILSFKVIFYYLKLVESFQKKFYEEYLIKGRCNYGVDLWYNQKSSHPKFFIYFFIDNSNSNISLYALSCPNFNLGQLKVLQTDVYIKIINEKMNKKFWMAGFWSYPR